MTRWGGPRGHGVQVQIAHVYVLARTGVGAGSLLAFVWSSASPQTRLEWALPLCAARGPLVHPIASLGPGSQPAPAVHQPVVLRWIAVVA